MRIDPRAGVESREILPAFTVIAPANLQRLLHLRWPLANANRQNCAHPCSFRAQQHVGQIASISLTVQVRMRIYEQCKFSKINYLSPTNKIFISVSPRSEHPQEIQQAPARLDRLSKPRPPCRSTPVPAFSAEPGWRRSPLYAQSASPARSIGRSQQGSAASHIPDQLPAVKACQL